MDNTAVKYTKKYTNISSKNKSSVRFEGVSSSTQILAPIARPVQRV